MISLSSLLRTRRRTSHAAGSPECVNSKLAKLPPLEIIVNEGGNRHLLNRFTIQPNAFGAPPKTNKLPKKMVPVAAQYVAGRFVTFGIHDNRWVLHVRKNDIAIVPSQWMRLMFPTHLQTFCPNDSGAGRGYLHTTDAL